MSNHILHLHAQCVQQPKQPNPNSSLSSPELAAIGNPLGHTVPQALTLTFQQIGMVQSREITCTGLCLLKTWLEEPELSGDVLPPLCLGWDRAKVLSSSYLTGNRYLQPFLPAIFMTTPRHS